MLILPALLLPAALAAAAPTSAASHGAAEPVASANVSITLTIGRTGGPVAVPEKAYKILAEEGSSTKMLFGFRTPIPTRSSGDQAGDAASTSYVYQNVGVSAEFQTAGIGDDRMLVQGEVEISGAREALSGASAGKPPMIATFQQAVRVVVKLGEKLRVAEGPDPDGGTLYLDLKAERLR